VMRFAPTTSVAGARERRAAVATVPPERRARAARAGTRGRVAAHRPGHATRSAPHTATPSVRRSGRTLDAIHGTDLAPARRAPQAWSTPIASRTTMSAAPPRPLSQTVLAGGALVAFVVLLGAMFPRRRGMPIAQLHEEAVVAALPLSLGWERLREDHRRAA
jgi:hypothetical protein